MKPEPEVPRSIDSVDPWQADAENEAELRAAIDAAERDALLSPEAFVRWLEAQGEESAESKGPEESDESEELELDW